MSHHIVDLARLNRIYQHTKHTVTTTSSLQISLFRLLASHSPSPYSNYFILPLLSKIFVTVILEIEIHFIPNITPGGRQRLESSLEASMLPILNHIICWTSWIQTPTGSCFHHNQDQASSQLESHQHRPVDSWVRRGPSNQRLCWLYPRNAN